MQASNSSNQCRQPVGLYTPSRTVGVDYVRKRLSNTMSTCMHNLGVCHIRHAINNDAVRWFKLEVRLKVKGSLL